MNLSDFDFELPPELIAEDPLPERSASRLLVYDRKSDQTRHLSFSNVPELLNENCVLVLNNSRVLPARIRFEKSEIFLVELIAKNDSIQTWKCLVRPGKLFQPDREIVFADGTRATVQGILPDGLREIAFSNSDFSKFLNSFGEIPLPPYIHKKLSDPERYQTVYAKQEGSVAAPTAGLHFTPQILEALQKKGVQIEYVTLHVGPGTFLPVRTENISDHQMHSESYTIEPETAARLTKAKHAGKKIIAVGSTSLRSLESSFSAAKNEIEPGMKRTALFLYPPAEFHFVDHLITNFHLPKSTLLMLVAAFLAPEKTAGIEKVHELYATAIREKYRFFSFGDAMLIW